MFGMNEIVGKAYFKKAPTRELLVTSRFYTLQGEGPFRGYPAYFVRLTKCNLACSFCDTYFDKGEYQTFDKIFADCDAEIAKFYAARNMEVPEWAKHGEGKRKKIVLVVTGGEPTLQSNLIDFLNEANEIFYNTQIESNGTGYLAIPDETTLVCSPKCLEKKSTAIRYLEPNKKVLERADCLKFVMGVPENDQYTPYSEIPQWALDWAQETNREVFVSPMNIYLQEPKKAKEMRAAKGEIDIAERSVVDEVISFWEPGLLDMKKNQLNHEYAADYCMRHGLILNLQVHLFASLA